MKHRLAVGLMPAVGFALLLLVQLCSGLYEDQIGKFDWRQQYVGKVRYGAFDTSSVDRIIVATESNVLAALSAKTGDIVWRQVLEKGARGDIKLLHVTNPSSTGARYNRGYDVITVTGASPALVRGWNSNTGTLEWEWSLHPSSPEQAEAAMWFEKDGLLYHVVPVWGAHLEVTSYHANTGQQSQPTTSRLTAPWIAAGHCSLASSFFACGIQERLVALDLADAGGKMISEPLGSAAVGAPKPVPGDAAVLQNGRYFSLRSNQKLSVNPGDTALVDDRIMEGEKVLLKGTVDRTRDTLTVSAHRLKDFVRIEAIEFTTDFEDSLGDPELLSIRCKTSSAGGSSRGASLACRVLASCADGAIVLIQQGKIKWTREESLAEIETADFLDLTLSDAEGAIEEELNNKNGDVFGALQRRISSQAAHVKNLFLHVLGIGPAPSKAQRAGLVRDDFGLHKMLVVITAGGKMFGIDNISGKHHWVRNLPNFTGFGGGQPMRLIVQRTSRFYPWPAQCIVLGRHRTTKQGMLYVFNPITGQPVGKVGNTVTNEGVLELSYRVQQVTLLQETGTDFLKGLLLLDHQNQAHVVPETLARYANNFYMFSADRKKAIVQGFLVQHRESVNALETVPIWQIDLSGASKSQQIVALEGKNPIEHVHSQGRVMADRSVLYKYINPNLIAVATHGPDNINKYILNVHLLDVVSGSIIFSMSHKRIRPPLHMVHSENWLVYSYYNDKVRRTEITSIELYEGKTQANSTVWSSLDAPPLPMVERQSYILPVGVATMKETITEKGITNKHILIALQTGAVAEMSWALLDPRRPVTSPEKAREEGIVPYMPELPVPHEILINYNQTVTNIRSIYTAPSGLESTCLVLVAGLDLFVTRVSPSKTFDLLKEDFDYFLITVVLIVLTTTSLIVKHLSSKKITKQAWK